MLEYFHGLVSATELPGFAVTVINLLITVAYCALIVVVGLFISAAVRGIMRSVLASRRKKRNVNNTTLASMLNSLIKYAIYIIILFQVLAVFGVSPESILAVAGIGSIAVGFGAKGLIEDVITGASFLLEKQFLVGDVVEVSGKSGVVESLTLRSTSVRDVNGNVHIYPNSTIKIVTNMSRESKLAVVDVVVPCKEGADRVIGLIEKEMAVAKPDISGLLETPKVEGIIAMDAVNMTIRVTAQCSHGENWNAERMIRLAVRRLFEREGIPG